MKKFSSLLLLLFITSIHLSWQKATPLVQNGEEEALIFAEFFSPNGDGANDRFVIKNLENYPINKIHIFNRFGDKIYEAEPYKNEWDGISNADGMLFGQRVPDGTYFYRFEYLVGDFLVGKNGKVILMR